MSGELVETEGAGAGVADGEGDGLGDKLASAEHRQKTFLAIAHGGGCRDGFVGQEALSVGDGDAPREGLGRIGRKLEVLFLEFGILGFGSERSDMPAIYLGFGILGFGIYRRAISKQVHAFQGACVRKRKHRLATLRSGGHVGDFDGELNGVAFAQEAWRVGLHHEVLGSDGGVGEECGAELFVVREAEEFPARERLGHGELNAHGAVGIGEELREEEGGFGEVFAGGDGGEVGGVRFGICACCQIGSRAAWLCERIHFAC